MKIAFYAPLKSPLHAVPSGDRQIAANLMRALSMGGAQVTLASELRALDIRGDEVHQNHLRHLAQAEVTRLGDRWADEGPADLWFTYHLYHKAPDWLGPALCQQFDIPYVVAEASVSPRQSLGPWQVGYRQTLHALAQAAGVVFLNPRDRPCVLEVVDSHVVSITLNPFIDILAPNKSRRPATSTTQLVTVAMMRSGDKLRSYELLASSLDELSDLDWQLSVIGDGPERHRVESLFATCNHRVRFLGQLNGKETIAQLANSDMMLWPAVAEAIGMALIEAMAAGIPVVAGRFGAIPTIIDHAISGAVTQPFSVADFSRWARLLIENPGRRLKMGRQAQQKMVRYHSMQYAAATLEKFIEEIVA